MPEPSWVDVLDGYADEYLDSRIELLEPENLAELVFEIVPRKVTCEPSAATEIVEELRALYAFLARTGSPEHAAACAAIVDDDGAVRLERELARPRNFGIAKSIMMGGLNGGTGGVPTATPRATRTPADRSRRNKRKVERKARKKNR